MSYNFKPEITKDFLLSKISEQEIFENEGIPVTNYAFSNPLREDKRPSCNFFVHRNGQLWLIDHAGYFKGDCFAFVQYKYGFTFRQALDKIAEDFNLRARGRDRRPKTTIKLDSFRPPSEIKIKRRGWNYQDEKFWGAYYIDIDTLNYFRISPIETAWVNGRIIYYKQDLAYAYHFGGYNYKLYFPFSEKFKFLTNSTDLQGWDQLPDSGEYLVITKSLKDVAALSRFGIPSLAPQSESIKIPPEIISNLMGRFENIYSLYDYDLTGVSGANYLKKQYGIPALLFNKSYKKDFSDNLKALGPLQMRSLINNVKEELCKLSLTLKNGKMA